MLSNFESLRNDPSDDFTAVPSEEDIMIWNAVIFGPQNTPFEDGIFKVTIQFCNEYPYIPPQVQFLSRIFHPNVYPDGSLCPEVLQNGWTPSVKGNFFEKGKNSIPKFTFKYLYEILGLFVCLSRCLS